MLPLSLQAEQVTEISVLALLQTGDGSNRDMKTLCHTDLEDCLPIHAEWVHEDAVILAKSASKGLVTKFVGIHSGYINESLDANPIPPTWVFEYNGFISGCTFLPRSQTMVLHAHDQCALWTCSWDHSQYQDLALKLGNSLRTALHTAPVISTCATNDGELLATATSNGSVAVWHATADGLVNRAQSTVHNSCISSMCFSGGIRTFLTTGVDGSVALHELKNIASASNEEANVAFLPVMSAASGLDAILEPDLVHDEVRQLTQKFLFVDTWYSLK